MNSNLEIVVASHSGKHYRPQGRLLLDECTVNMRVHKFEH